MNVNSSTYLLRFNHDLTVRVTGFWKLQNGYSETVIELGEISIIGYMMTPNAESVLIR